jgi:hypothetical protein
VSGPLFSDAMLRVVIAGVLATVGLCVGLALVAVGLRFRNALVARRWTRLEARLEPAVLDALEGDTTAADFPSDVLPADPLAFATILTRFARRLRGPELARLTVFAEPLRPAIRERLRSRSPETRARAVDTLGLLAPGDPAPLVAALDDPSPLVAMIAARALTRERSAEHAEALIGHLHRFEHWRAGFLAAMLAGLGPTVAPVIRHALADRRQPTRVRVVAAEALTRLHDLDAAPTAAAVADSTADDPEIRAAALRLLSRIGVAEQLPTVRRALSDRHEIVRIAAARALAELAEPGDVDRLVEALDDPSGWVAGHAARGLARGPGRGRLEGVATGAGPRAELAREALSEASR